MFFCDLVDYFGGRFIFVGLLEYCFLIFDCCVVVLVYIDECLFGFIVELRLNVCVGFYMRGSERGIELDCWVVFVEFWWKFVLGVNFVFLCFDYFVEDVGVVDIIVIIDVVDFVVVWFDFLCEIGVWGDC